MIRRNDPELLALIRVHEGYRRMPYRDTEGKLTIGYGLNLNAGISSELAEVILEHQVSRCFDFLETYQWFPRLSSPRQRAMVEMCFQLGAGGLIAFERMLAALDAEDYQQAAKEMLASRWHEQTPARAEHCAKLMARG